METWRTSDSLVQCFFMRSDGRWVVGRSRGIELLTEWEDSVGGNGVPERSEDVPTGARGRNTAVISQQCPSQGVREE